MRRRVLAAFLLALTAVAVVSAPALAGDAAPTEGSGGRISIDGGLLIGGDEQIDGVVISVDGDVRIDGVVKNDVYVVGGDVRIFGRVRDDVLVIGGDVTVIGGMDGDLVVIGGRAIVTSADAFVGGDIRSTDQPRIASGAQVSGSIEKLGFDGMFGSLMFTLLAFLWLAVTVSGAIVGLIFVLVFPRAAEASARAGGEVGRSIAWGVGVGIVGPIVAIVAIATLVGVPLGLGLGAGLVALGGLGYVTSAWCLGRSMVKATNTKGRIGTFFAGFGILRAIAIIPGIGGIVGFLAMIYGIGVLANAAWRAGHPASTPAAAGEPMDSDAVDSDVVDSDAVQPMTEPDVPATVGADTKTSDTKTSDTGTSDDTTVAKPKD